MASKPGKPGLPAGSVIGAPAVSLTTGRPSGAGRVSCAIAGFTYLAPNKPWKLLKPPGSSGRVSGRAWVLLLQIPPPAAQWIAMPTKSVCASAGVALASFHSGEPVPKTLVMSPAGVVLVFSRTTFAVETAP